ncbi:MAG: TlpA family protein disulfide reductase ['Candidatus Kapabacteria' thiocyanatum]|nr:TlpA family protein disulfide reductase ['Candidatus Kapabacteria' thiocyanatum]
MRLHFLLVAVLVLLGAASMSAQDSTQSSLPAVKIRNAAGELVNTADLSKSDAPVVISFWATWCKPCIQELNTYHGLYEQWRKDLGVTVVAVSIDDSRNAQKVPAFIKGRGWDFNVLLDVNGDFKRAMNVNNVPHTFLVKNGKIVWQHSAYAAGDEEDLEREIKKLLGRPTEG